MQSEWELRIHTAAVSAVHSLPRAHVAAITAAIAKIRRDPWPGGGKLIVGFDDTFEFVEDIYRIVYQIDRGNRLINVAMINLSVANL